MRILVTGVGAVSPFGVGSGALAAGLAAGATAIAPLEGLPAPFAARPGGQVRGFDPAAHLGLKGLRALDRLTRLTLVAGQEALASAGLDVTEATAGSLGVVLGTAYSGLDSIVGFFDSALAEGPDFVSASAFANTVMNAPASQIAVRYGMHRLNATVTTGAASGLDALGYALGLLRTGRATAILAGGAEEICPAALAVMDARHGATVPGEGAAFLLLEREDAAVARGARPLAVLAGHGAAFDPGPARGKRPDPGAHARAIRAALADAGLQPDAIAQVFAAAGGDPAVDEAESAALADVFGRALSARAPKRQLGEATGASGAFAAAFAAMALGDGAIAGPVLLDAFGVSGHAASVVLGPAGER